MTGPFEGLPDAFIGALADPSLSISAWTRFNEHIDLTDQAVFRERSGLTVDMQMAQPELHMTSSNAERLQDGDVIKIGDRHFVARTFEPDIGGMTRVTLEVRYST